MLSSTFFFKKLIWHWFCKWWSCWSKWSPRSVADFNSRRLIREIYCDNKSRFLDSLFREENIFYCAEAPLRGPAGSCPGWVGRTPLKNEAFLKSMFFLKKWWGKWLRNPYFLSENTYLYMGAVFNSLCSLAQLTYSKNVNPVQNDLISSKSSK